MLRTVWLGRFANPIPLRCRGRYHVYSAEQDGEPVVVTAPGDPLNRDAFASSLDHLARAHAAVDSPVVAPLREVGSFDGQPFASFTCDAVLDGEQAIARLGEQGTRVAYSAAMAAVELITSALEATHRAIDPITGAPCVYGALAWANVIIERDGGLRLFGAGHNVIAFDEYGRPAGAPSVFMAPEVAAGAPATTSSDVYAFVAMQRALLAYTEPPQALRATLSGSNDHAELAAILNWANERVLAAKPAERATIDEVRRYGAHEIALLGLSSGAAELRAQLAALIAAEDTPCPESTAGDREVLTIAHDASWLVAPGGERYAVENRAMRRILLELVRMRRTQPGERIGSDALVETGWPGENPIREAGLNRLYVAISQLRKRGLRDAIDREAEGYRIAPHLQIVIDGRP